MIIMLRLSILELMKGFRSIMVIRCADLGYTRAMEKRLDLYM